MKTVQQWFLTAMVVLTAMAGTTPLTALAQTSIYDQLKDQMEKACPVIWEDLGITISSVVPVGDVWEGDATDRAEFETQYAATHTVTAAELTLIADTTDAVAAECAAYRIALLDELLDNTPMDVSTALDAASGATTGNYLGDVWHAGDVRVTGRSTPAVGWVFLTGQTLGSATSGADLAGDEYADLFELAKAWAPNAGTEDWATGQVVTLPDMRGRALVAADNMGGQAANTAPDADTLGGTYGSDQVALSTAQLPTHGHTTNNKGNHQHTLGIDGDHKHNLKTSAYQGGNVGTVTYMTGYGRTNYQNTITQSVQTEGDHQHSMNSKGSHNHTVNDSGSSAPVSLSQPSIVFNVEMKF